MSGILTGPYFQSYFQHPTAFEIATMVSILEIGAFVGCIVVGTVSVFSFLWSVFLCVR